MNKPLLQTQSGLAIIEAMIAIAIFSFGVLGLIGLFATTAKITTQAKTRADASLLANECITRAWAERLNLAALAGADECLPDVSDPAVTTTPLPQGLRTVVIAGTEVTVTVTWRMPGETTDNSFVTKAQILANL